MRKNFVFILLWPFLLLPGGVGIGPNISRKDQNVAENKAEYQYSEFKKESKKYIDAVRIFADNAIKSGKDVYGPKKTPLFVDGLNIESREPVKWRFPKGDEWVLVDIGNQQNFYRTLCGLSGLTGDSKYKKAAVDAVRYSFQNLQYGKLLAWGGHIAYNATADSVVFAPDKGKVEELKSHYPFYDLMWEVDPVETKNLIENIWNSHILDWSNLDFNRHGKPKPMGNLWKSEYKGGDVFFWGKGLTFKNAGSDLYYAAALLSKFTGDQDPLIWAKRLDYRYVETRDPKTGLSGFQFSQAAGSMCTDDGSIRGDRAQYQYGEDFPGHHVVEGTLFPCYGNIPFSQSEICSFVIAETLGEKGDEFRQWAIEEIISWAKSSYRKSDNTFVPMLTDGTSMEGYVCKKEGYFGPKGRILTAGWAGAEPFWIYARACQVTDDSLIWSMTRNIARANKLGDIGVSAKTSPVLNLSTENSDYRVLFGFLSLHKKTGNIQFLKMAVAVGNNILKEYFNKGYFTTGKKSAFTRFDNIESLALLHLAAVLEGKPQLVPLYPGGRGFFASAYGDQGHKYDNQFIYKSDEPE
jgi:pectate lyase